MSTRRSAARDRSAPRRRRPRRARGPTPDVESSRQRIHAAALRLFARYGLEGVSLQMIADEVGLHKSSLFHHYRGKIELAHEVCETALERVVDRMKRLDEQETPELEGLLSVVDELVDYFAEEPEVARLILSFMTAPEDSDLRIPVSSGVTVEFFTLLSGWLDRARRAGAIRNVNIRQAIPNLIGAVLFYPSVAYDLRGITGPDPFGARATEIRKRELRYLIRGVLVGD